MSHSIRIGSRGSNLALAQSNHIAALLREYNPDLDVSIEVIHTKGDKVLDAPFAQIGDKGLFTKELEAALLERRIDVAVHSLKDLPTKVPAGLALAAIPPRENPFDAFVCNRWELLAALPEGAKVGTSSLRRRAQVLAARPDLDVTMLRGNVETRLKRVDEGAVDAAILACAGLNRLGLSDRIRQELSPDIMISAPGQGALGIETRADDQVALESVGRLNDTSAQMTITAERACLAKLEGGCQVPIGAFARIGGGTLTVLACVCSVDGTRILRTVAEGAVDNAIAVGEEAAANLLDRGAAELIAALR